MMIMTMIMMLMIHPSANKIANNLNPACARWSRTPKGCGHKGSCSTVPGWGINTSQPFPHSYLGLGTSKALGLGKILWTSGEDSGRSGFFLLITIHLFV